MSQALPPLVFFGSGSFGLPVLHALAAAKCVKLVVSQPDRPAGRGGALTPTPVSEFAIEHEIPLLRPEDCNSADVVAEIRRTGTKAFAVIAYGQKMGPELLRDIFAINLHGSLLPRWRGAAPYQRALMEGDERAGVSVIGVAERMDAGAVYARAELQIGPQMTAGELHDALSELGPAAMLRVLRDWVAGTARGEPQDEALATRAHKLSRADAWVDLSQSAEAVRARINGLSPWPGCSATIGAHPLKVTRAINACRARVPRINFVGALEPRGALDVPADATATDGAAVGAKLGAPGELLADGTVACGTGCVRFLEVQPAGGKVMAFDAWLNGRSIPVGTRVVSSPPVQA